MKRPIVYGGFLDRTAEWMRQQMAAIVKLGGDRVEQDIRACKKEAAFGAEWAKRRQRIQSELQKIGISEADWTKRETGSDVTTMRRRVRLVREWGRYEVARRKAGDMRGKCASPRRLGQ